MVINKEIKEILSKYKVSYKEGVLVLLAIYYELSTPLPDCISEVLYLKVLATGIVREDGVKGLTWVTPLFENQEVNFSWVEEFRENFKKKNLERAGNLNTCIIRMKKFFSESPHIRAEDVMGASKMYIRTIKDPQYLITSHKFIYDGTGINRTSPLEEWLEKYFESRGNTERSSESKIMQ